MKYLWHILTAIISLTSLLFPQPTVVSVEELPLGSEQQWQQPRFSPGGNSVYYTSAAFRGIWSYSLKEETVRQVTDEPGSGYGFTISPDETKIAYRTTTVLPNRRRQDKIVVQDLSTQSVTVIDSGKRLSPPTFVPQGLHYSEAGRFEEAAVQVSGRDIEILGIEETKIALKRGSEKILLDPLGTGRYIWPSLSPDGTLLVAHQMERGTFICDLEGNVETLLGRRNAPSWSHDGQWIAYMDDRDDGHRILSSEIMMVSRDGTSTVTLTNTPDGIEMYPSCSPTEKKIVFNTLDGRIFLLTYSE